MKVSVRQFSRGDFSTPVADLIVNSDGFLVCTDERRMLLPARGVSEVQQAGVKCYEHSAR